jgi:hypothetical protein
VHQHIDASKCLNSRLEDPVNLTLGRDIGRNGQKMYSWHFSLQGRRSFIDLLLSSSYQHYRTHSCFGPLETRTLELSRSVKLSRILREIGYVKITSEDPYLAKPTAGARYEHNLIFRYAAYPLIGCVERCVNVSMHRGSELESLSPVIRMANIYGHIL